MKYSSERRESVLKKLLPSHARTVAEVSEEEGICTATLFNWRNSAQAKGQSMPDSDKPAKRWNSDEKFMVVLKSASMNEMQLAEYCRKRGVYQEQIAQWREACKSANEPPSRAQRRRDQAETRADQKKIKQLETELHTRTTPWQKQQRCWCCEKRRMRSGDQERTSDQHPGSRESHRAD